MIWRPKTSSKAQFIDRRKQQVKAGEKEIANLSAGKEARDCIRKEDCSLSFERPKGFPDEQKGFHLKYFNGKLNRKSLLGLMLPEG